MANDYLKVIELLKGIERVADQVLQNKTEILELDKRRQSTRLAIRDLGKTEDRKAWITVGSMLVKLEKSKALELLKKGTRFYLFCIYFVVTF